MGKFDCDIPLDAGLVQRAQNLNVTITGLSRLVRGGDVFPKMIEDDGMTGARNRDDRAEGFVQRFSSNESSSKAMSRAQAPDAICRRFLCREPEDQIAQRVRRIRPFV